MKGRVSSYMSLLSCSSNYKESHHIVILKFGFLNYTKETSLQAKIYSSNSFKYSLRINPETFSFGDCNSYFFFLKLFILFHYDYL